MLKYKCIICRSTKDLVEMGEWAICLKCSRTIYMALRLGKKDTTKNGNDDAFFKEDIDYELQNG